jgi:hypothetical protein
MFWVDGSASIKRIILSMSGGTVVIFVMYGVNLGLWFSGEILLNSQFAAIAG